MVQEMLDLHEISMIFEWVKETKYRMQRRHGLMSFKILFQADG